MSRPFQPLTTTWKLESWCQDMEDCEWFAIDTEFIAEKYDQPLLCLIQVATPRGDALIDPLAVDPTPF